MADSFKYTPDPETVVHKAGAIKQLCKPFQSHENGLPELFKNSSDEYARRDRDEADRIILFIGQNQHGARPSSISIVDFGGMTSEIIENRFRVWADPDAALAGAEAGDEDIQGGHGNGGKCYLCSMFKGHAEINTVKEGVACGYGVEAGTFNFGYVPNRKNGRNFKVGDVGEYFVEVLNRFGIDAGLLPPEAVEALYRSNGFTMVTGVDPKHMNWRLPMQQMIDNLVDHPQMQATLRHCRIYVIGNNKLNSEPLAPPVIEPIPNYEAPRVIPIPETLVDPVSGEEISTTDGGAEPLGELHLRSSNKSLKMRKLAGITYWAKKGFAGLDPIEYFDVLSPYKWKLFGDCYLRALEDAKTNERGALSETPLTRALRVFIAGRIAEYAEEFEKIDKRATSQAERDELSRTNEMLDKWKNNVLEDIFGIGRDEGDGGAGGKKKKPALKKGKPTVVELRLGHTLLGVGVSIKPVPAFFEKDKPVRSEPYRFVSSDPSVIEVDEDLNVLTALKPGKADVHVETLKSGLKSVSVLLEVADITKIELPAAAEVMAGRRTKIDPICTLASGDEFSNVLLEFISTDDDVAIVTSAGVVIGIAPGTTEIMAGDARCSAVAPTTVTVSESTDDDNDDDDGPGRSHARILISEADLDPDTLEEVRFLPDEPPVTQRPKDFERRIWWINSAAPLAKLYREKYGVKSPEWRIYHVERLIEGMVQIGLTADGSLEEEAKGEDWLQVIGDRTAEMQAAAQSGLIDFIVQGTDPNTDGGNGD